MNGNYKALEAILKGYWLQPFRAARFYLGFEDQLDLKSSEGDGFELVYVAIRETNRNGDTILFTVDVYSLDKTAEGGVNTLDIVSDTHQKLTDFESALMEDQINGIYLESPGVIRAIENGAFDGLDGNVMEGLVIDMDAADYCSAPESLGD